MAFEPSDFEDLIRFLDAHPDVRDQLRRRILSDDFLRLPLDVQALGDRTDRAVARLAEAQARTERAVEHLGDGLSMLVLRVDTLVEAQGVTDASVRNLAQRTASAQGYMLEAQFRERAPAYFASILKRPRVVEPDDLEKIDAAFDAGHLAERDVDSVRWLDAIISGKDRREPGLPETLLALEVSVTIDADDVTRVRDRAAVLRAAGYRAFGVVGGETITTRAAEMAEREGVMVRLASPDGMPRTQTA